MARLSRIIGPAAALAASATATPAATGADWIYVGRTDTRTIAYFVDRLSIRADGDGTVAATVYSVHAADSPDDDASAKLSLDFDCATPRYRFRHLTGYTAKVKQSYDEAGSNKWRDIGTGSLDAAARTYVCARGKGDRTARSYGASLPFTAGRALLTDG